MDPNVRFVNAPRISRRLAALYAVEIALGGAVAVIFRRVARTPAAEPEADRLASTRLAWVGRGGAVLKRLDLRGRYLWPRRSPDGRTVLMTRTGPGKCDLQTVSLLDGVTRPLMAAPARSASAIWSPDGGKYAFARSGKIFQTTPAPVCLFESEDSMVLEDWSPDGRWIVFTSGVKPVRTWLLQTESRKAFPILESGADVYEARISPDGKWMAFTSNPAGRDEVCVAPFPPDAGARPVQVSRDGGHSPQWGSTSGELFYISAQGEMAAASWSGRDRALFSLATLDAPGYKYRFGGYCVDAGNGLVIVLEKAG